MWRAVVNLLRNILLGFVTVPWAFAAIANEYKARSADADLAAGASLKTVVEVSSPASGAKRTGFSGKSDRLSIADIKRPQTSVFAVTYQSWTNESAHTTSAQAGSIRLSCKGARFAMSAPISVTSDDSIETAGNPLPANKFQDRIAGDPHDRSIVAVCLAKDLFADCERSGVCSSHVALVRHNI